MPAPVARDFHIPHCPLCQRVAGKQLDAISDYNDGGAQVPASETELLQGVMLCTDTPYWEKCIRNSRLWTGQVSGLQDLLPRLLHRPSCTTRKSPRVPKK